MFDQIEKSLIKIKKKYKLVAIKQSFEDEGVSRDVVNLIRNITYKNKINHNIKIGGCEAKSDMNYCEEIQCDGIVAPMIETDFALKKFIQSSQNIKINSYYVNIETITAAKNIKSILLQDKKKILTGITIGRSDFTSSMGLSKKLVNSTEVFNEIYKVLKIAKSFKYRTTVGGNLSIESKKFINDLYKKNLIDNIESRNVCIKVDKNSLNDFEKTIQDMLMFEYELMNFISIYHNKHMQTADSRKTELENRFQKS